MLFLSQHFFQQLVSDGARQMGQEFPFLESLSRHLLVGSNYGGDKMVRNTHLFMLYEEYALVGLRPHAIKAFHLVLSPRHSGDSCLMEMVHGVHAHHLRDKNLLIAPSDLQVTVAAIGLEKKTMAGIFCSFEQLVDCYV